MPCVIALEDETVASLSEVCEALQNSGFHPDDDASVNHAALQLRRLGNDRSSSLNSLPATARTMAITAMARR
jgi:uncharacterized protein with GYD domain